MNCCPVCELPIYKHPELGSFAYYFAPHETSIQQRYEQQLDTFKRLSSSGVPIPNSQFAQSAQEQSAQEQSAQQQTAQEQSAQQPAQQQQQQQQPNAGSFLQMDERELKQQPDDPYAALRGMEMSYYQTYVYGDPTDDIHSGQVPAEPDLPPCCNLCNVYRKKLQPKDDNGCCVYCAHEQAPYGYFTRRQRAREEAAKTMLAHGITEISGSESDNIFGVENSDLLQAKRHRSRWA